MNFSHFILKLFPFNPAVRHCKYRIFINLEYIRNYFHSTHISDYELCLISRSGSPEFIPRGDWLHVSLRTNTQLLNSLLQTVWDAVRGCLDVHLQFGLPLLQVELEGGKVQVEQWLHREIELEQCLERSDLHSSQSPELKVDRSLAH